MRKLRLLAVFVAFALVVAACGDDDDAGTTTTAGVTTTADGGGATTAPAATVSGDIKVLLHQNPPLVEYMNAFNERFEAANPDVNIEMEIVATGDLATAMQTRLTAGEIDVIDFCASPCAASPPCSGSDHSCPFQRAA